MDEKDRSSPRNSSRRLVFAAVGLLIAIAIAGIVLTALRGRGPTTSQSTAASTPPAAPALTGAASAQVDSDPNGVMFAAGSDQLPASAGPKLSRIAEAARGPEQKIVISAKFEARNNRAEQMDLAKKRTSAVRQDFQAKGIPVRGIRIDIAEYPAGLLSARDSDRVEITLR